MDDFYLRGPHRKEKREDRGSWEKILSLWESLGRKLRTKKREKKRFRSI